MAEVSGAHLRVGDTFPNKDVLAIRIAEEAIQVNALITVTRSDVVQYRAVGINFYAQANKNQIEGWVVNKIQVVEEMVIMMTRMRLIGMLTATTMEKWELCSEDVCMKYLR
jgi:3-deoxy-D-manno-octulosonate 8-phosphate phosphatase KdsC-like HAD superfamily phosphatase